MNLIDMIHHLLCDENRRDREVKFTRGFGDNYTASLENETVVLFVGHGGNLHEALTNVYEQYESVKARSH